MKTLIPLALILLLAFTPKGHDLPRVPVDNNKALGSVEQKEGIYIFILSKPVQEAQYLGSVKKGMAWTGQPEEMLNSMMKKMKKEYPSADALVFTTIGMDKADAYKFK